MKRVIDAFFMAWGSFLNIPCPKRWNEKLNKHKLVFLPIIGLIIGILMGAIFYGLNFLPSSVLLKGFIALIGMFLITGFFHWDGLMDVGDAIFSRKDLEVRQKILKDSKIGAFGVLISGVVLLGFYACFCSIFAKAAELATADQVFGVIFSIVWIFIMSRWVSGANVLIAKPMKKSQYSDELDDSKTSKLLIASCIILILAAVIYVIIRFFVVRSFIGIDGNVLIACFASAAGSFISGSICKKRLGGMNGDIAGTQILVGDLCGFFALALI